MVSSLLPLNVAANDLSGFTQVTLDFLVYLTSYAKRLPDGELVLTQQLHQSLARSAFYLALPRVGVTFRYSGHGSGGDDAYGRVNHDRSFDAHISLLDERKYLPALSFGLRDFIGTGWYSSEYIVATKSIGHLDFTTGLGFGRVVGKNAISNPFSIFSSRFNSRKSTRNPGDKGGTLGNINWFHGDAAAFYGIQYHVNENLLFHLNIQRIACLGAFIFGRE